MKTNFCRVMRLLTLRHAASEALVNTERGRRYSFSEYHLLTNRIANAIRGELGLARGEHFFTIVENDNLALLHFPTFFKQEATAVFTNYRESMDEHRWQLDLVKPRLVFIELALLERYAPMLRERGITIVVMDPPPQAQEGVLYFWDLVERASAEDNEVEIDVHDNTRLLRFTGGTTGRGKCAMYSFDNLMGTRDASYIERDFGYDESTRCLHIAPLSHGSLILFLATLFAGGTTLTMNQVDLPRWMDLVQAERVTHSFLVPTALYRLLDLQQQQPRDLSSLRTVVYGAAPMSPSKMGSLVATLGNVFVQGYAATEAAMFIAVLNKRDHLNADGTPSRHLGSAGRVNPGVEVFITDAEGRPVPVGATGEIRIRCRATIAGYYGNPEGTAAEFVDGAWRSGDLGYLDEDGFLTLVDRLKDMIITGGFNVYAVEVEAALNAHPAVQMSAVVGVPHEEWGEAVHAEVVLRPGASASEAELIEHAKASLSAYKVPKSVRIVAALPLSPVGKVLRRAVKQPYWAGRERHVH
ncbi:AMP-binding protein [Pelomonas sp. SE-A7]|uniref:class I adenylate-forming enzyme family protein n=1 Tax=Pelomonas sp. SE-A7 TaxID=3054953 RepID=UPI00259C95D8|nr:AMP-binding protein [Pelomonas sp. SE-A7]MDM4764774.1 AMP-binding protein [Pelomonas sp. SE-A7]